ncbi:hypothetical protein FACS1894145_1440 [Bacteroidia bacterium]|nr:hypothetical protein FACS1894145_1440 [Bacteroidia bacterium]
MGKFVITLQKNGEYMFNLKASNGQVILTSEGYANKAGCLNGIESVKKNAPLDERYERKESKNGKPFFSLKAGNSQIIGKSELYESVTARENGIESVKKNAPDAAIDDQTVS